MKLNYSNNAGLSWFPLVDKLNYGFFLNYDSFIIICVIVTDLVIALNIIEWNHQCK